MGANQSASTTTTTTTGYSVDPSLERFNAVVKTPYQAARRTTIEIIHDDFGPVEKSAAEVEAIVTQLVSDLKLMLKTLDDDEEDWEQLVDADFDVNSDKVRAIAERVGSKMNTETIDVYSFFSRVSRNFRALEAQHQEYGSRLQAEALRKQGEAFGIADDTVDTFARKVLSYTSCTESISEEEVNPLIEGLNENGTIMAASSTALTRLQRNCIKMGTDTKVGKIRKTKEPLQSAYAPYASRLTKTELPGTRREQDAPLARGLRPFLSQHPKPPVSVLQTRLHGGPPKMRKEGVEGLYVVDAFTMPPGMVLAHIRAATRSVNVISFGSSKNVELRNREVYYDYNFRSLLQSTGENIKTILQQASSPGVLTANLVDLMKNAVGEYRKRIIRSAINIDRHDVEFLTNSGVVVPKYYLPGDSVPNKKYQSEGLPSATEKEGSRRLYEAVYMFPGSTPPIDLRFQKYPDPSRNEITLRDFVEFAYQQGIRYLVLYDIACYHFPDAFYEDPVSGRVAADALQQALLLGGEHFGFLRIN